MAERWTPEEDHELRKLYPQGVAIRVIADRLGRTEDAVSERRRTLRLPPRPRQRPWSRVEDDLLRAAAAAGLPAGELAGRFGRSAEQIRRRRRALLGTVISPRPYTDEDDDLILTSWRRKAAVEEIASKLGRSPGSIRLRAQKLGCYEPVHRRRWQAYEDAVVRDGYELGLTCTQIASELASRSPSAVAARAAKLGLASHGRIWTARDDRALRALAREGLELERAAQVLARTPEALRARARKLGLTLHSHRAHQIPRRWTPAEDEQLVLHAGLNPALLAELLDRSPEAISQRLRRLGLRDTRERSPHHLVPSHNGLTPGEVVMVERELRAGGPRRHLALARRLGRQPAEIRALAGRASA